MRNNAISMIRHTIYVDTNNLCKSEFISYDTPTLMSTIIDFFAGSIERNRSTLETIVLNVRIRSTKIHIRSRMRKLYLLKKISD